MKVAVISSTVFAIGVNGTHGLSGYGGLEQLAWQHAKGLAEKGHEVILMAPDDSTCPNVTVFPTGPAGRHNEQQAYSKYWPELLKVNCVIDHSWQKFPLILKMEGRLKAPSLCWSHAPVDGMYSSMPEMEKPCFVCISDDQRTHFEALFSRPARTCLNGIDLDHYKPLDIPRTKRFLFLARFSKIKGPHLALDACWEAGVGLDLIGDTTITNEPEYLQECKAKCDGRQLRLAGNATRGECAWWFSQAHCMLHPNKYFREPLGLAPLEAQACGTPVIAWDNGAMRETIKHGETGVLVKNERELLSAVREAAALGISDHMRNRCREWVASRFSLPTMIDRVEELCYEAIAVGW